MTLPPVAYNSSSNALSLTANLSTLLTLKKSSICAIDKAFGKRLGILGGCIDLATFTRLCSFAK